MSAITIELGRNCLILTNWTAHPAVLAKSVLFLGAGVVQHQRASVSELKGRPGVETQQPIMPY